MPTHRHQPQNSVTQSRLKELVKYDTETGIFKWRVANSNRIKSGSVAGSINSGTGYMQNSIDGKNYSTSRLVFLYMEGYWPENEVDHINRNKKDNRWINLRHVSGSCNIRNSGIRKDNTSGVTGVYFRQYGVWEARISANKKPISLGYFENFTNAVIARRNAEIKYGYDSCNKETAAAKYLKNI